MSVSVLYVTVWNAHIVLSLMIILIQLYLCVIIFGKEQVHHDISQAYVLNKQINKYVTLILLR
jgi:uncharacterized membrane protein YiaA